MKKSLAIILIILGVIIISPFSINADNSEENSNYENTIILYQFYGQGCPHCSAESKFLEEMQQKYPSLEVKEHEIYFNEENRQLFTDMAKSYKTEIKGVPTIFIDDRVIVGFSNSLEKDVENEIQKCLKEKCADPLLRVNGNTTQIIGDKSPIENPEETGKLDFFKIISLAFVDAINPCALAVLTLMLITILTYNPKDKKKILYSGLAFTLSVFIMYLIYGLIIIKFFQLIQGLSSIRVYLYKCLGVAAIIIGSLNIRDYISYRPGNVATEMPLMTRPKVKKLISKITSPKGAFTAGLFVTVFLLPCTIGPYVIAGGILSAMEIIKTIPPLILYNAIFVLPMLIITGLVYKGVSKVEDISGWKDKNIKILHLVAGIIMVLLGITMLTGWI